ncbi:hypothetical protein AB0B66_35860 [Catellatospora sp. NPDC049111]|uniref:hypothetical protein n=1 Tax=Catellatospora sp. NPDC049111 TaxID=3155271 RepID=UPI00340D23DB
MPDRDSLGEAFTGFRSASYDRTVPPGVDQVQRTVTGRRRRRAVATTLTAAVCAALALWLPDWRATPPPPAHPSPSASPSLESAPSMSAPPTASPSTSTSTSPQAAGSGPGGTTTDCKNWLFFWSTDNDRWEIEPEVLRDCPGVRVTMVMVTYHWSATAQKLVRYRATTYTMTAAKPSLRLPSPALPPDRETCGWLAFMLTGTATTSTIPNAWVGDGIDGVVWQEYWERRGSRALWMDWHGILSDAAMRSGPCGTPASATPPAAPAT